MEQGTQSPRGQYRPRLNGTVHIVSKRLTQTKTQWNREYNPQGANTDRDSMEQGTQSPRGQYRPKLNGTGNTVPKRPMQTKTQWNRAHRPYVPDHSTDSPVAQYKLKDSVRSRGMLVGWCLPWCSAIKTLSFSAYEKPSRIMINWYSINNIHTCPATHLHVHFIYVFPNLISRLICSLISFYDTTWVKQEK